MTTATNQPPLYYALEAVPYWISPSNDLLTRLVFMRLLSALMAAGTVLAVFLFLRELLPHTPWAWTVGALMVAFQPMFDFIGAGVNGDNLLYLASALTIYAIARAYRRGLTTARSAAIGAALAVGMLAKLTFLALVPGAGLALLLLAWRARASGHARALRLLGVGIGGRRGAGGALPAAQRDRLEPRQRARRRALERHLPPPVRAPRRSPGTRSSTTPGSSTCRTWGS